MSRTEADLVVEQAIAAEQKKGVHDPRIQKMFRRDVVTIYAFVIALWVVLWSVFFFIANPLIEDEALRWLMIALGLFASVFNSVGMIQNTRRLRQEALRFYSQDLFWQDQKRLVRQYEREEHEGYKRRVQKGENDASA